MQKCVVVVLASCIAAVSLSGCMQTRAQRGAAYGGAAGAAIGAVATRSVGGAVVGGALGTGIGYLLGSHAHHCGKTNIFTGRKYRGTCYS